MQDYSNIAILAWALLVPTAFVVFRLSVLTPGDPSNSDAGDRGMIVGQALRSPQFIVLAATFFACCATALVARGRIRASTST